MAAAPANGNGEMRRMAYQLAYYEAQAKDLQRQAALLQEGLEEVVSAKEALKALEKSEGAVIFPLGGRVFVRAVPQKAGTVLADSGSGVIVEKTAQAAIADLEANEKNLREGLARAQGQLGQISQKASELNAQAEELARRAKQG